MHVVHRPSSTSVRVDLFGSVLSIERELVIDLRNAAAARAGVSSRFRDLSLVLDRSLTTGTLIPRRHEFRLMIRLAAGGTERLHALARDLQRAGDERSGR